MAPRVLAKFLAATPDGEQSSGPNVQQNHSESYAMLQKHVEAYHKSNVDKMNE